VLIEVAILQVTGDDTMDVGLEMLQEDRKGDGAIVSGGIGQGLSTQGDPNASGFPEAHTLTKFTGGAFRYLKPDDISVLVKAVASKATVNILSQPILLVNDNEDADFTTKVSEPTVALSQGTATTTTAFAGFADATTRLRISPQISPGGYINLKITQDFEEFTGNATTSGVPPPKVSNSVTTVVTVPDNYTAILGGFVRDSVKDTLTGIPFVMDIPILGRLASFQSKSVTKSRLYLFVRPRILSTGSFNDLRQASREKKGDANRFIKGSDIEEEVKRALSPGSGKAVKEALLPFEETGVPED
jgi:type II secretory pathway component GspD/PulD (secretin)